MTDYLHAIALGIIQGVTELFPVSSAAHTLLLSYLFGWRLPSLPFVVMLHLGTFLAVLVYFARDYWALVVGVFRGFAERFAQPTQRLALMIVLGTIPPAIVGKLFEKQFDALFASPMFAAIFLLATGLVLFVVERMTSGKAGAESVTWTSALGIGTSQIAGLFPGGSRSGFSIAAGMFAGLSREEAARFSFLLAGPIILGASLLELRRIVSHKDAALAATGSTTHGIAALGVPAEPTAVIVVGFIVAFFAGWAAIRFFMRYVDQHRLTPFAIYCWLFGLAMIGVILARAHGA